MNFTNLDLVAVLARERQKRLIQDAAERRLLRLAKEAHPSQARFLNVKRRGPR